MISISLRTTLTSKEERYIKDNPDLLFTQNLEDFSLISSGLAGLSLRIRLSFRYPTPIRLRPLGLLAISLTTSNLILDPNWGLLVELLLFLFLVVLFLLIIWARFVFHRWAAARASADSCCTLGLERASSVAPKYKDAKHEMSACSRFSHISGSTEIVHHRLRDDLLDSTVRLFHSTLEGLR